MDSLPDSLELIIDGREKDLGGFTVRRVLPYARHRMVGPWIFFDHMGPAVFAPGDGINVRPHPHIALATVTYLFEGAILHRDSLGSLCEIVPGDINLMVAGRGIVHSEREYPEKLKTTRRFEGLQLWLALPTGSEEIDPAFHHHDAATIPVVDVEGVGVRVMMGSAYGVTSPVPTFAQSTYFEARLEAGQSLAVPADIVERAVYLWSGDATIAGVALTGGQMAVLKPGAEVTVSAAGPARFVLIGGDPVGERHIYWNFVASDPARIELAKADWKAGRFPKVPGDDKEFIPLPE